MSYKTIYAWACEHPSKPAVIHNGTTISYSAFANAIGTTFDYLDTQDLPEGHNVVVIIHNLLDCWVAVLALQALGLNTICIRTTELIEFLGIKKVAGIVTTEQETPKHQLEPGASTGNRVITIPNLTYTSGEWSRVPAIDGNTVIGSHILYTSGTTGNYKKLFYSADLIQKCIVELNQSNEPSRCNADTKYHCANFGLWTGAGYKTPQCAWHVGGCVIIDQRPDWHKQFLQSGVTRTVLIPEMVDRLLESLGDLPDSPPPEDFILVASAGFISRQSAGQLIAGGTKNLIIAYGSSEINIAALRSVVTDLDELHWLSCTQTRTVEIIDTAGNICPIDVEGELRVRMEEPDCSSYLDDPEASEKVFRDGYFYPGDMAVRRADGRIRVLGRSVDVVNFRGQKYSVAPIEENIQNLLGVSAVCLFSGINDAEEEEVVIAIESEQWPEKSDLNNLGHEFAQFDQVRFAIVYPFPRTQTGTSKINRVALRKLIFPVG